MKQEREEPTKNEDKKEAKSTKPKHGVVFNCLALAVREEGSKHGTPVSTIYSGDEVKINYEKSTNEFYFITTNDGVAGFCMKSFITIK